MPTANHLFCEALIHSVKNMHKLGKRAPFQLFPLSTGWINLTPNSKILRWFMSNYFLTFCKLYSWSSFLSLNPLLAIPLAEDGGVVEGAAGHIAGPRLPVLRSAQAARRQHFTSTQDMVLPAVRNPLRAKGINSPCLQAVGVKGRERGMLCPSAVCALSVKMVFRSWEILHEIKTGNIALHLGN